MTIGNGCSSRVPVTGLPGSAGSPALAGSPNRDGLADPGPEAVAAFGARIELAQRYADRLAEVATIRGLLGPREVDRIWSRHLLNSAALADLLPDGARVIDVGSGAGLPGIPLAISRPDLEVVLLEPMARRVEFLVETVNELGLPSVSVVRGRAEDRPVAPGWVVARAVAPLDRLVGWTLPLVAPDARLLALKGATASTELAEHRAAMTRVGGRDMSVTELPGSDPTWVVSVSRRRE